jgi:hypothetical protein
LLMPALVSGIVEVLGVVGLELSGTQIRSGAARCLTGAARAHNLIECS